MKVLNFVKTSSLLFDERVVKEINSMLELGVTEVDLLVIENQENPTPKLSNVNIHKNKINRFLDKNSVTKIAYILCIFFKFLYKNKLEKYELVWIHDPIMIFVLPLLKLKFKGRIIWDLHEMPPDVFFRSKILGYLFLEVSLLATHIVVANKERGEELVNCNLVDAYLVLNNYPIKGYDAKINNYSDEEFEKWIVDKDFGYCQSATHPSRNFESLVKACLSQKQYLLVVGEKNRVFYEVRDKYKEFDKYIKVLGKKPSYSLPYYISKAKYSFVFYSNKNRNNYYCAPNRLYLSLKESIPVIVGANPTMATIIKNNKCGVSLAGYGENENDISKAINKINQNFEFYKKNAELISENFIWDSQSVIIKELIF